MSKEPTALINGIGFAGSDALGPARHCTTLSSCLDVLAAAIEAALKAAVR